MSSPVRNKRAGAKWETDLLAHLQGEGYEAFRIRQTGVKDEGDLIVRLQDGRRLVIEAKSGEMHPGPFVDQATSESENHAVSTRTSCRDNLGLAVVKRRGHGPGGAHVLVPLQLLLEFLEPSEAPVDPLEDRVAALERRWLDWEAEQSAPPEGVA